MKHLLLIFLAISFSCCKSTDESQNKAKKEAPAKNARPAEAKVSKISKVEQNKQCYAYAEINLLSKGDKNQVNVDFVFQDREKNILHVDTQAIAKPIIGKLELVKGWAGGIGCTEFDSVEILIDNKPSK